MELMLRTSHPVLVGSSERSSGDGHPTLIAAKQAVLCVLFFSMHLFT
jgi:hypothetical protein